MQRIARELNLSETVFVSAPDRPGALARVRIFTPMQELRFAGHPTIGTAFVLTELGRVPADARSIVLSEGIGPVPVRLERRADPFLAWLRTPSITFGETFDRETCARALGLSHRTAMRLVVIPQGIRRVLPALVNQFIALLKGSALVYFLGLIAGQRELFQVGRDLNAQTGNLSPLVAAGLFYLILTVPLTHLVNVIDARLRRGRSTIEPDEPPEVTAATLGREMT